MFDDNPAQKERTIGLAALAAIGLGGAVAVDMLVTGGFDFSPGRAAYDRQQPSVYVRAVDAADYMRSSFAYVGDYFRRPPDTSASEDRLAGGDDGSAPPDAAANETGGDALYREIEALYADSEDGYRDEPAYEDAPAIDAEEPYAQESYEEPAYEDEYVTAEPVKPLASETESPW
jgi:hypothetical protein